MADLEAVAGINAVAAREQREQETQTRKKQAFDADCVAVLGLLPPTPQHTTVSAIDAALRAAGTPKGDKTIKGILERLAASGQAVDLSNGAQSKQ